MDLDQISEYLEKLDRTKRDSMNEMVLHDNAPPELRKFANEVGLNFTVHFKMYYDFCIRTRKFPRGREFYKILWQNRNKIIESYKSDHDKIVNDLLSTH